MGGTTMSPRLLALVVLASFGITGLVSYLAGQMWEWLISVCLAILLFFLVASVHLWLQRRRRRTSKKRRLSNLKKPKPSKRRARK